MGDVLRGTSHWPRIERAIEQVAVGEFGELRGIDVISVVKAAYVTHASEALGIGVCLAGLPLVGDRTPEVTRWGFSLFYENAAERCGHQRTDMAVQSGCPQKRHGPKLFPIDRRVRMPRLALVRYDQARSEEGSCRDKSCCK